MVVVGEQGFERGVLMHLRFGFLVLRVRSLISLSGGFFVLSD